MWLKNFKIRRLTKKIKYLQHARQHNPPKDENIKLEINYYHTLASIYTGLFNNKSYPFAMIMNRACLRAAASLGDIKAMTELGQKLLEEAKFRSKLEIEGTFASANNEQQMKVLYEDAHAYLQEAAKLGAIEAKRAYGLCYINGWGVSIDKDKGFELIVNSIEQENSWDKVPQIFEKMGLNKPEFFSALVQHRNKETKK